MNTPSCYCYNISDFGKANEISKADKFVLHLIIKRKPNIMSNMTNVKNRTRMPTITATCHNWTGQEIYMNKTC